MQNRQTTTPPVFIVAQILATAGIVLAGVMLVSGLFLPGLWLLASSLAVQGLSLIALTLRPIPPALADRLRRLREKTDAFGLVRALWLVCQTRTAPIWAGVILILTAVYLGPLIGAGAHTPADWLMATGVALASFLHLFACAVIVRAAPPHRRGRLRWGGFCLLMICAIIVLMMRLSYLPQLPAGFAPLLPVVLTGLAMLSGLLFPSPLILTKPPGKNIVRT